MKEAKLIHIGSVKDIYLPKDGNGDELLFRFSDRYSVFDWGEMPDQLEDKGKALACMGELFFELLGTPSTWQNWQAGIGLSNEEELMLKELKHNGLAHHSLGIDSGNPAGLIVRKVDIHEPSFSKGEYNYQKYQEAPTNSLVPLEVVFRFGVPKGSSLLCRIDDVNYRRVLGLAEAPIAGDSFSRPIIEYSTKLESSDQYLGYDKAQEIAGLSDFEFSKLHSLTILVALRLKDLFSEAKIELWDGKFEFAFGATKELGRREFVLVDSIGPDELRLVRNGKKLSKEFLRGFYRDSEWLKSVEKAKSLAKERGQSDWKAIVRDELKSLPQNLSEEYKAVANAMYPSLAQHLCHCFNVKSPFNDVIDLDELENLMKKCGL